MTWTTDNEGADVWTPDEDPIAPTGCPPDPIRDAITAAGGVSATARALGVSRQIVHRWLREGMAQARAVHVLRLARLAGVDVYSLVALD